MPDSLPEQTARLMQVLDFTADDLWANQQGRFSQRQKARVDMIAGQRRKKFLLINIFGIGLLILVTLTMALRFLNRMYDLDTMPTQALIVIGVVGAIMAVGSRRTYLTTIKPRFAPPQLSVAQGQVRQVTRVHRNVKTLTITIDNQVFYVNPALYAAFQDGRVYQIHYFTPFLGPVMLSATLISES